MAYLLVRHEVADYDQWKPYFDDDDDRRLEYGQQGYHLFRDAENPNEIVMLAEYDSEENARAFSESEELPEIMKEAGVKGEPEIRFLELTEEKTVTQSSP
ncbi:putative quinol monooxygenase [Haloarcula marina]|uniref:putative quinol monooxygenase n=1 Tax=Haloarcula marina TaxID=2961574 RepID=UPI0020B815C4|nr:antibiotic biosynthesis monooxygenase [Halomicroarcula marina]